MRSRVIACLIFLIAGLVGCASGRTHADLAVITLTGTPITVHVPMGFVAADEDEVITYPRRPMRYFYLPELPNGGTPAYPEIYIEQLGGAEMSMPLDSYVSKTVAPSQYQSLPFPPKALSIDGVPAVEFAKTGELIADFEGGGAGHAVVIDYEIVFQYRGINYHCMMETGADNYKNYVSVFEQFCSSVRFLTEKRDATL